FPQPAFLNRGSIPFRPLNLPSLTWGESWWQAAATCALHQSWLLREHGEFSLNVTKLQRS
ncbi:unnamed protein product, partial [Linum tenue]